MAYTGEFAVFEDIIQEMALVYQHDNRPWMIGFSGGKDSTMLCCLVLQMLQRLPAEKRNKTVYIVSSDTMVENPIVRDYMHNMSKMINENCGHLNVKADIIYPKVEDTFWSKVIGLGYPTPEPPGFRWCTERLKIQPMNAYTLETIRNNGEIVILLGVRKAESTYRANHIRAREIEGKLLIPHKDIENAYVYNPLTEIPNEQVWRFLLMDDAKSPWGSDNKYLFSLYQGEHLHLGEEQSVIGEIDENKIPVTGNSRFGCWICTMVKEDKSLKAFIDGGESWLEPLRDYRDQLLKWRSTPTARETKRKSVLLNNQVGLEQAIAKQKETLLLSRMELSRTQSKLEADLKKASIKDISAKAILMLDKLQSVLYRQQITKVEDRFRVEIRTLMRKTKFIDDIRIDENFNIYLYRNEMVPRVVLSEALQSNSEEQLASVIGEDAIVRLKQLSGEQTMQGLQKYCSMLKSDGMELPIRIDQASLSNGEKQIFIMALYHSLVQLGRHEIPFIIDTPFARIDTEHRHNISQHFFSKLKGQVFILSTNEEINSDHVQILKEHIAATYLLENTDNKRTVVVQDSYFEV